MHLRSFAGVMSVGGLSGVAGGMATRLVESGGKSAGTLTDVIGDAAVGAGTAGLLKGGGAVFSKVAKAVAPKAARALSKIRALTSEKAFQKQYKQLGQAARKANPCNCFAAGTLVWTESGLRAIETLKVGDQMLSWSEQTGEVALKPITETLVTPDRPLIDLAISGTASGDVITTTPGHPFWVEGTGWVHAGELTGGDALRLLATEGDVGVDAAPRRGPAYGTVFNLTVAEFHTYFVGTTGVLLHNASPCDAGHLVRFGPGPESAQSLAADAARAEANGFPHGVSTRL